jgi:predicted RNase H-like nuclease
MIQNMPICIGIDPAPSDKGHAVVCIEEKHHTIKFEEKIHHSELRKKINEWESKSEILIGWDAPLTGPQDPDDDNAGQYTGDFTQREIESYWRSREKGGPLPKGISVQGYANCQHWTITRNLLGLPRVGKFDKKELPFKLLSSEKEKPENWSGKHVVEVHPALAIWLWVRDKAPKDFDYRYKGGKTKKENREKLVELLFEVWDGMPAVKQLLLWQSPSEADAKEKCKKCPDVFDALVAAVLAYLWMKDNSSVELSGDSKQGAFLLPRSKDDPAKA